MVATLCLLGCALAGGQTTTGLYPPPPNAFTAPRPEYLVFPRLERGQEVVYQGTFDERAHGGGVEYQRAYRLEMRLFVLDTPGNGADVAFLTILKHLDARITPPGRREAPSTCSVRLERAHVNLQGKVTPKGSAFTVPLDGPPTLEAGMFVETPRGRIGRDIWDQSDGDRPARTWRPEGTEMMHGISCLKLVGVQQSDDWDRPRGDHTAWRVQDRVWLAPKEGIAYRVERVIELRAPAHQEPTQRSILRYDWASSLRYPRPSCDERREEILQACALRDKALPLLTAPAQHGQTLNALLRQIERMEQLPPTPYRAAIYQVKRWLEAASRGESLTPLRVEEAHRPAPELRLGAPAPDFLVTDFSSGGTTRLKNWLGRPIVLVFYKPRSPFARELLVFAQTLFAAHNNRVVVLGMAISEEANLVRGQRDTWHLTFPLLNGISLLNTYKVVDTPHFIILDARGIARASYTGWGEEIAQEIRRQLER